ncbi:hypothetical protein CSUB01_05639 [Colletotrichum sublineola]|uniref:Uncharacterized protein n=1 Tax=Colletotrichum sublineola TaxID=1173701 RepID=A0A066XR39_COLSU|nr:hypothetical protein CSUB01_05639 [Colletotrichum sublineola]
MESYGQCRLRAEWSPRIDPGHLVGRPHRADKGRPDNIPRDRPRERLQHGLLYPPLFDYFLVRDLPPFDDGGGNILLEETPKELVAAVIAAAPLFFEGVRNIKPNPDENGNVEYFRWMHSAGMPISNYHAACSAGAVYGTPTFLSRTMTGCVALCCLRATDGKVSDIFGVWEVVLPDKIVVTEE